MPICYGDRFPDFDNLPQLTHLIIDGNQFDGETIPDFSYLPLLEELHLNGCDLEGSIPNFSNLPNLRELRIHNNQLDGSIPDFSNLPNIEVIWGGDNLINGSIPDFSNMPILEELYLQSNQLSGNIPDFSNLPELRKLFLNENQLSGSIPDFSNLGDLNSLLLYDNQLTGTIPDFTNFPLLTTLHLYENQLTGTIPDFSNLPVLQSTYLHNNQLSGSLPDFSNIPNLVSLLIQNNQLTGVFPDFSNLPNLFILNICPNQFIGGTPTFANSPLLDTSDLNLSCIQGARLTGYIYYDENGNCIKDPDEPTIPNALIATTDFVHYTFSNESGFYTLESDLGTHTFNYFPPNDLWEQTCPDSPMSYTVSFSSYTDSLGGYDFANDATAECPLMTIELGTPLLRRCFMNTYTVDYCNMGTEAADSVMIYLWFPPEIIPISSSEPYTVDDDGFLVFDLGTMGVGECSFFTVTDSVSCDAVLGSTACVEGYVFPDTTCFIPSIDWDESDIRVSGNCLGSTVQFLIENMGEDMADSSDYKMYEDDLLTVFEKFKLTSGESLELNYTATGQAMRVTAHQRPSHPFTEASTDVVEVCGSMPFSLGFVNSQPDEDRFPFYDEGCQEIIGSYDPNDKTVIPTGIYEGHHIAADTELEYRIRFQNVGNDTAFQVIVIDTIDTDFLDVSTLRLGTSSHDYTFEVKNGNVFVFTFADILLVDSMTNEAESHGFLKFHIAQNADNPEGELIENEAAIYFDYNQPVITNPVFNTIGLPELVTAIEPNIAFDKLQANVFFDGENAHIKLPFVAAHHDFSFRLYSVLGHQVSHIDKMTVPHDQIAIKQLPKGVYVYEIRTSNGQAASGKLVIP